MDPIIQKLIFNYLIPEQKLYYPESAITWKEMLSQSIRSGWWPGIAASWWRVPKLQYTTVVMAAASTNQVEMLRMLHEIGAPFLQKHLDRAAYCGHADAFRVIVPHVANRNIESVLCQAVNGYIKNQNHEFDKYHVKMGDHLHVIKLIHAMFPTVSLGQAFCMAIDNQHWKLVLLLIALGYTPKHLKSQSLPVINFCLCTDSLDKQHSLAYAAQTGELNIVKLLTQYVDVNFDGILHEGVAHTNVAKYALSKGATITEVAIIHAAELNSIVGLSLLQPMYCGSYDGAFCVAAYYGSRAALVWLHNAGARSYTVAMYNAAYGNQRGLMRLIRYWHPGDYATEFAQVFGEQTDNPKFRRVINLFQLWQAPG